MPRFVHLLSAFVSALPCTGRDDSIPVIALLLIGGAVVLILVVIQRSRRR